METKTMSIKDAAKQLGKCQGFVRAGLRYGVLPFGTAVKMSSKWSYYISPEKFKEYVGSSGKEELWANRNYLTTVNLHK